MAHAPIHLRLEGMPTTYCDLMSGKVTSRVRDVTCSYCMEAWRRSWTPVEVEHVPTTYTSNLLMRYRGP